MTEPIMDFSDQFEPDVDPAADDANATDAADDAANAPSPRRGRPRSPETMERDEKVLTALRSGPQTKLQLVETLDLTASMVYLSLWRLKRENRVERTSTGADRHVWQVIE